MTVRLGHSAPAARPLLGTSASCPVRLASHHSRWRDAALIRKAQLTSWHRQSPAFVSSCKPERENRDGHFAARTLVREI